MNWLIKAGLLALGIAFIIASASYFLPTSSFVTDQKCGVVQYRGRGEPFYFYKQNVSGQLAQCKIKQQFKPANYVADIAWYFVPAAVIGVVFRNPARPRFTKKKDKS